MGARCAKRLIRPNNTRVIDISAQNAQINNNVTQIEDPRIVSVRYAWQNNNTVTNSYVSRNNRNSLTNDILIYRNRVNSRNSRNSYTVYSRNARNYNTTNARNSNATNSRNYNTTNPRNYNTTNARNSNATNSRNSNTTNATNSNARNSNTTNVRNSTATKVKSKSKYTIDQAKMLKQQRKLIKYYQKQNHLKNNFECCVCYTKSFNLRKKLKCKHSLCKLCYRRLDAPKRCPICRKSI